MNPVSELRSAFRHLRHDLGYALTAMVVLGLGIGAATAAFAVVRGVLLRPLPFPEPGRLVTLCDRHPTVRDFCVVTPPDAAELAEASRTLTGLGIGRSWNFRFRRAGESGSVRGGLATPGLFEVLGAGTVVGRRFAPEDQEPGPRRVALLSHAFWRARLGADPAVVGTDLLLDGQSYQIVGVLGPEARVPRLETVEVWVPLPFSQRDESNRGWRGFQAIGRLAPGATRASAEAELDRLEAAIAGRFGASHEGSGIRVGSLHESVVGRARPILLLFLGSVLVILIIGCVNLANLVLARGLERQRELGLRLALGGDQLALIRMLAVEQLLVALAGAILGVAVASGLLRVFVAAAPAGLPRLDQVRLDALVVGFATAVTALAAVLAGVVPALRATRIDPMVVLAGAGRVTGSSSRLARQAMVVAQVALATALAIGAGLLGRSLGRLLGWEPGFPRENLSVVWTLISREQVAESSRLFGVFERAVAGLAALPGVARVGMVSNGPLFGGEETGEFARAAGEAADPDTRLTGRWFDAGPGYFATLGLPLVRGREFGPGDGPGAPLVAVLNETMARRLWPDGNPVGQFVVRGQDAVRLEVIGVVRDVPSADPSRPPQPEIYWPIAQWPRWASYLVIRGPVTAAEVTARLAEAAPELEPSRVQSYQELESRILAGPRFNRSLSFGFAAIALALALVGVYGLMAYTVAARRRELGVRIALGATGPAVGRMVLSEAGRLAVLGGVLGGLGGLGLGRAIGSVLIGVAPGDPVILVGVTGALIAAVLAAAGLPAFRAARTDPMTMLRTD